MAQRIAGDGTLAPAAAVRLSQQTPQRRAELLAAYERDVYGPAFPDASIREDPSYWAGLLDAAPYPPPPQPLIDVVLLLDPQGHPVGGATIEFYRTAKCGLLTYLAVGASERGKGRGRQLVALAAETLAKMAGGDVPMIAETERLEDAADAHEAEETRIRQHRLAALGARWVRFDYVMPPLRSDSAAHRLHMMLFDPGGRTDSLPAAIAAALIRELAAALGADLSADADTAAMMAALADAGELPVVPLPAVAEK